jgi:hypothetical protein
MPSHSEIVARYLDVLAGDTDRHGRPLRNYSASSRIYAEGTVMYSYGRHFPLVEYFARSKSRRRALFLLNGDRWRGGFGTTTRHQEEVRSQVTARAADFAADVLIVPFSALGAARIRHETIAPLEIRADRTIEHVDRVPADMNLDDLATARFRDFDNGAGSSAGRTYEWTDREGRTYTRTLTTRAYVYPSSPPYDHKLVEGTLDAPVSERGYRGGNDPLERRAEGWIAIRNEHLLGDSLFTAQIVANIERRRPLTVADVVTAAASACRWDRDAVAVLEDMGDEVIETAADPRRRKFLSSFDYNEPAPLYFLATLPRTSARTVAAAFDALAPPAVHAAYARGRDVDRQGDIFVIATDLTDSDVYGAARSRCRLTQWTRGAKPRAGEAGYVAPLTAADLRRVDALARRYWRESFRGAVMNAYANGAAFPRTERGGRRKRYRELERRAEIVRHHVARGRLAVLRGDARAAANARIFRDSYRTGPIANPRDEYRRRYGTNALTAWTAARNRALEEVRAGTIANGATWTRNRESMRAALSIHGTAHTASEVVKAAGGAVYVRGIMRHVPALEPGRFGERDHRDRKLGDGTRWYLAIRNTVPRQ